MLSTEHGSKHLVRSKLPWLGSVSVFSATDDSNRSKSKDSICVYVLLRSRAACARRCFLFPLLIFLTVR